jgi:hypothetical protein
VFIHTEAAGTEDLNEFIDPSSGFQLRSANGINNRGLIVASGFNAQGQYHAFLPTPVREPAPRAPIGTRFNGLLPFLCFSYGGVSLWLRDYRSREAAPSLSQPINFHGGLPRLLLWQSPNGTIMWASQQVINSPTFRVVTYPLRRCLGRASRRPLSRNLRRSRPGRNS